jgi:hypothetical protein
MKAGVKADMKAGLQRSGLFAGLQAHRPEKACPDSIGGAPVFGQDDAP